MNEADVKRIVEEVLRRLPSPGSATSAPSSRTFLPQRVVTLEVIEEALPTAQEIAIGVDAVITPAARDALRERGVTLSRQTEATPSASIVVVHPPGSELPHHLPSSTTAESHAAGSLDDAIGVLGNRLPQLHRGILESDSPALGVHLLGQRLGARAFTARDVEDVHRAQASLRPNVLVLDRRHVAQSGALVHAFVFAGKE